MTSAQEARADGWQRDTAQRNATVAGLARENRQLREQLAAKGHAMTEPVPDTGAFAEPESMAERRDHITVLNENTALRGTLADLKAILQAREDELSMQGRMIAAAVKAEHERIRQLAIEHQAVYWVGPDDSPVPRRPFALLLLDELIAEREATDDRP